MSWEQVFLVGMILGLMIGFVVSGIIWIIYDIRQEFKKSKKDD